MKHLFRVAIGIWLAWACLLMSSFAFSEAQGFPTDDFDLQTTEEARVDFSDGGSIEITLRERSQVNGPRVYIQDLGTCKGDELLCDQIVNVDFCDSALPGREKVVLGEQVRLVLEKEFPGLKLSVDERARVRIKSGYVEVSREDLELSLRHQLEAAFENHENMRLSSLSVQLNRPIKAWPGEYRLRFPMLEQAHLNHLDWIVENFLSQRSWQVIYEPMQETYSNSVTSRASVRMEIESMFPIAKSHVARGSILTHENFEYKWRRLTRRSADYADELTNIVGLMTKQAIRSGSEVSYKQLEVPEVVSRGQKVKMVLVKGKLKIVSEGKALKSGGVGQHISVFYPQTKKTLQARVIAPSLVEVRL